MIAKWGLNTYMYAPKDDLKHRVLWGELYPDDEAARFKWMVESCGDLNLNFIYAISPGLDITYSSDDDLDCLKQKCQQLSAVGCRSFAILFDDIPNKMCAEDERIYGSFAEAQAAITNELYSFLEAALGCRSLLFCPTIYCERMADFKIEESRYLRELGEKLADGIKFFWTGPEVISQTISAESARALAKVIGRKPVIWDNLYANDYDYRRIFLGPYAGRPEELIDEVDGILINPNCQFEANYIPLRTFVAYQSADKEWNPRKAYRQALAEWRRKLDIPGSEVLSTEELELICDCFYLPHQHGDRVVSFVGELKALLTDSPDKWGDRCSELMGVAGEIIQDCEKLVLLKNRDLVYEIYHHLLELREEMDLLIRYLKWAQSNPAEGESFTSAYHLPGTYRGGFAADIQQVLAMNEKGRFLPDVE